MATNKNIPGIIPVANSMSEFGMEWDASLMPIAPDYTAIEASIYECITVGCSSIWIVANDDTAPLIRHRIGEIATDITSVVDGRFGKYPSDNHVDVPIYYVPIHPKHMKKLDCYSWSVVWGAHVAYSIMKKFSRWTIPEKYYVSFPLGVFDYHELLAKRKHIVNNPLTYLSYEGKTIRDGVPISFLFSFDEWKIARDKILKNSNWYMFDPDAPEGSVPLKPRPPEERWESLRYSLKDVFENLPDGDVVEVSEYYDLTTWDEYRRLLSSDLADRLRRPSSKVMYKKERKLLDNE